MRFLLNEAPDRDGIVRLRGEDYHYLVNVRRLKPGAVFKALLPAGAPEEVRRQVAVTVLDTGNHTLSGAVLAEHSGGKHAAEAVAAAASTVAEGSITAEADAARIDAANDAAASTVAKESAAIEAVAATEAVVKLPPIILFQALPKGTKMDLIVRQLTEAGITEIVPFVSERSVPKVISKDKKTERWRRIVKEARQQSGSIVETRVREALSVDELFAYWETLRAGQALGLVFSPKALEQGGFHRYLYSKPPLLVLAVGPEGGFSAAELQRFEDAGFKALSLGGTVLRTETAALYGAAAVKIILTERAWWKTKPQSNESAF